MTARACALGAALALVGAMAPRAHAETPPNVWERAKVPSRGDAYALHLMVQQVLLSEGESRHGSRLLEDMRGKLEEFGAETAADPRLRFDLGEVYEQLERHDRAIAVLAPALLAAPDEPAAVHALYVLSLAYAHTDQSGPEREVYQRFLARSTDCRFRFIADSIPVIADSF